MKNITDTIKRKGKKVLVVGGLGLSSIWLAGNTGCQTLNPQGEAFMQGLGQAMVVTYATESIKREVNPNQINIYNQQAQQQPQTIIVPENVSYINGKYKPAPGYVWDIPNPSIDNLKVRKMTENEILFSKLCSGQDICFTCNYWRDFNNDGKSENSEYINIKKIFGKNERINACIGTHVNLGGRTVIKELLDNNGNTIKLEKEIIEDVFPSTMVRFEINPEELSAGDYVAAFYADDNQYLGKTEFEVRE